MNSRFIIIPGCCDLNRGDQALGWETSRIAKDAGFIGDYSILAEKGEPVEQSIEEGYEILRPVLEHPSRKFSNKDNIIYNKITKLKWGGVALKDFFTSFRILKSERYRKKILQNYPHTEFAKTIKRFYECEAVFMKGGGLIQSHGGIMSTYATYYRIYHIFLAEALGKPVYIMPNSFGPFKGPLVKWMVKKAFTKCEFISVRENKSKNVMQDELNIKVSTFPDLAFYLQNGNIKKEELLENLNIPKDKKIVAITMRPYRFPSSSNPELAYEKFKKEMRNFIKWLYQEGYMPLIVEHTFAITSHENDGDCITDVISGMDKNCYRLFSDRTINCRQLKDVYGCCDYIVGTRFHSLIFSLSNMVPGIAISYDGYKSIGIMKDMKLGSYVIDITDVKADNLCLMFNEIVKNKDKVLENIGEYLCIANKKRKKLITLIKK